MGLYICMTSLTTIILGPSMLQQMVLFYFSIAEYMFHFIVYMHHVFFINSSADGHLGCFHFLAIVSSAAENIKVCVSFRIMVFSGHMPRSEIAGS